MMDGDGREQDVGTAASREDDENGDPKSPFREEGRGQDRHGGGALATDKTDKAVSIQSIVSPDDYAGSSESGV